MAVRLISPLMARKAIGLVKMYRFSTSAEMKALGGLLTRANRAYLRAHNPSRTKGSPSQLANRLCFAQKKIVWDSLPHPKTQTWPEYWAEHRPECGL